MFETSSNGIEAAPAPDMRFAFYISPRTRTPEQQPALIELCTNMALEAEEAGFDGVFLTEHHVSTHNPFQNSLQFGAYLAPQLKRMYVGLSTVIPTLWQPVRMIEQCNLLDLLTRGKCVIGLGAGSMEHEFDAFGRDVKQRDMLFEQTMAAVQKLWHFEHGDEPFEFETLAEKGYIDRPINPSPYRKPTPILARATFSGDVMEETGARGWPLFIYPWAPAEVAERLAPYWQALYAAGHSAQVEAECRRWTGTMKWIHVAETDEEAERDIDAYMERLEVEMRTHAHAPRLANGRVRSEDHATPEISRSERTREGGRAGRKNSQAIYGSPASVTRQLKAYEEAGLGVMMGMFLRDIDEKEAVQRSFRLFIDEVLPRFQSGPRDPYAGLVPAAATGQPVGTS